MRIQFFLGKYKSEKGSLVALALVFGGMFLMVTTGLSGYVLMQKKFQAAKEYNEQAFHIAEAGLEYYKWYLAHNPEDFSAGESGSGPFVFPYTDPERGEIGEFSLFIEGKQFCGELSTVEITSTGRTHKDPSQTRTVYGKYTRPSVAEYAFILNSNVWAGADREIFGRYHSNGGIRMDGLNHSLVESGVESWECSSNFGCAGTQTVPGVFGAGANSSLWKYPSATIDFGGITLDLAEIKQAVQNNGGIYLNPTGHGYHIVLNANRTASIYRVLNTHLIWTYSIEEGYHRRREIIDREQFLGTVTIPQECPIIYAAANLWLEGEVSGKVSVISARENTPAQNTNIYLSGDITYANGSEEDGLTVIAENNIHIPLLSPDNMELNGIFIAQKGNFGRNHYEIGGRYGVPWQYIQFVKRHSLFVHGSIVSNGRVGTQWVCRGLYCSGYANRTNTYDRTLANNPPPLTPFTSTDYRFIEWRER